MDSKNREELERVFEETLTEGDMEQTDRTKGAVSRLNTRYEYRVRSERDPIAEETKIIRKMAVEPDDRYDAYVKKDEEK